MLLNFSVENFRSFRDENQLTMIATRIKDHEKNNTFMVKNHRVLRSTAIYGANASGKSNLFRAISFMKYFVINSSKNMQSGEDISVEKFRLSTETENKDSTFEIVFFDQEIIYRYGFCVNKHRVSREWLYHIRPSRVRKEELLFCRENDAYEISKKFNEGDKLQKKTRNNALFLSVVAQFNGEISQQILKWFRSKLMVTSGLEDYQESVIDIISNISDGKNIVLEHLRDADLGVADFDVRKENVLEAKNIPEEIKKFVKFIQNSNDENAVPVVNEVSFMHEKYNEKNEVVSLEKFKLRNDESKGTEKYFSLAAPVLTALSMGATLIVDELESSLHPILTKHILKLFNSEKNHNNAQLIFNTHDTNLLNKNILRRDQIWFVEKDKYGATDLYSLVDFNVRQDASFEKDYLLGKYGAIPFVGEVQFEE